MSSKKRARMSGPSLSYASPLADCEWTRIWRLRSLVVRLNTVSEEELWRVGLGKEAHAPPITFTSNGHPLIAVSAGGGMWTVLKTWQIDSISLHRGLCCKATYSTPSRRSS